ncbi:hypothetical protein PC9H_011182 [Pleurotus ostreatus]|uniref:Uncharacterized protein n=1 Tax=Pleurotus ostreatus TaxID=5322 RepID=A0A8H6ZQ45_PLEOS|nr:uncharacterized protein PC9H_011182 [Pleurotus ostreatus]KAF7423018.1 hypothetical protein PC9H_011182 [Pleurotus ostreatus]
MGSARSKNGAITEEDKKALRRENYKASTASSDRNSRQARAEDVLSTLEQAALLARVPNMQEAASLALSLLDSDSPFKSLATDACDLVYAAMNSLKNRVNKGRALSGSQEMKNSLRLIQTIKKANDFALGQASRGVVSNFVSRRRDAKIVQKYREELNRYSGLFGLQSHITIREAVSRIQGQSDAILEVLTTLGTPPSNEALSNMSSLITAFGSIVNDGQGTFNSIDGNSSD